MSQRTDIIITKADKGGAVVIMDVKDYINKAHRQLIKDHYKNLNKSPTATNATLVNDTAQDSKQRNYSKKKLQMA